MLKRLWSKKLARFLTVGVFNTLFDLTILNTLVFVGHLPYLIANLMSASTSMTASYFLNHKVVFRSQESFSFRRFIHFFAVTGVGILGIQSLVIYVVKRILAPHHAAVSNLIHSLPVVHHLSDAAFDLNVGKILAVLIAMSWNFAIYHLVIFKETGQTADENVLL
jgi:putative flippase GtrA